MMTVLWSLCSTKLQRDIYGVFSAEVYCCHYLPANPCAEEDVKDSVLIGFERWRRNAEGEHHGIRHRIKSMLFTRCLNRTICAVCCGSARNRLIARTQQFWRGLACIEASFSNSSTVLQKTPRQSVQDSLLTARSPSHMFGRSLNVAMKRTSPSQD